jgi:hypothetical protein
MIRKVFIFGIPALFFALSILGCGESSYYDKRLKMRVQRLDSDLEGRWSINGVTITEITPDGPAEKSGLEEGELISSIVGERHIKTTKDYKSALKDAMRKDGKATLIFADRPPVDVSVRKLGDDLGLKVKREGQNVTVAEIKTDEPADLAGIRVGDVIVQIIDEKEIKTVKDYRKAVKEIAKHGNSLVVQTSELSGVKLAAIEALGNLGDRRGLDALMAALESDEVFMRRPAAQALEKFSEQGMEDERLVDLMIEHLQPDNEPDPEIRRSSAAVLGTLKSSKAIPYLIAALEDEIPGVRFKAGLALADIGTPAVEALIDSLQHDDASVQNIAASALGDIGGGKARQALTTALNDISAPTVQLTVVDALAKIGDEYALNALEETQKSTNDIGLQVFIAELIKSM